MHKESLQYINTPPITPLLHGHHVRQPVIGKVVHEGGLAGDALAPYAFHLLQLPFGAEQWRPYPAPVAALAAAPTITIQ